jgi:hypothetical protein
MGGAFLARADDATAASWNPAGLSYLRRPELSISGVRDSVNANEPRGRGWSRGNSPDFLAVTYPISLGPTSGSAQVSFQRVFTFAGTRNISREDFTIRALSEGGFDVFALGTGLRVFRGLRVGATLNRWTNGFDQELARGGNRKSVQTTGYRLSGWNANLGLIWVPTERLNLGLVGKTGFTGDVRLARTRTDCNFPNCRTLTRNEASRSDVEIDFPGAVGVGASWRLASQLTVSLDYTRTFWSSSEIRNFFTLPPTPADTPPPRPEDVGELYPPLAYPTLREPGPDTEQIRGGVEYVFLRGALKLPVRLGYFSDRQHFRVEGKAPRFSGFTVGAGMGVGPLLLDSAFVYESGSYRLSSTDDLVDSIISRRILLSLIYRHGSGR